MSTRSYIGLKKEDDSIECIYCHYDGYIESGVGEKLLNHYKTKEDIQLLLDIGDIRSLHETISTQEDAAYGKESTKLENEQEYLEIFGEGFIDYCYLFKDDTWYVAKYNQSKFEPLLAVMVLGEE